MVLSTGVPDLDLEFDLERERDLDRDRSDLGDKWDVEADDDEDEEDLLDAGDDTRGESADEMVEGSGVGESRLMIVVSGVAGWW